eukprot:g6979.t1
MMKFTAALFSALLLPASCFAGLSSIWRHSAKIKRDGFLTDSFAVQGISTNMAVRQVPGDGNCLFHAISACLDHACNGTHPSLDLSELMPKSAALRKVAVDYLVENLKKTLYLEKEESVPVYELLSVVAAQYNMTAEHYCEVMRQSSVWGGGPEIVALSNALCRPIHVYELASNGVSFCFRRMACFGSPSFDDKQAIHILSADSRFPNLKPGRQLANGNHFLALFPCPETVSSSGPSGAGLGGGGPGSLRGSAAEASAIGVGGKKPGRFRRMLSSVLTCSCLSSRREAKNGAADRGGAAAEDAPGAVDAGGNAQKGAYPRGAMDEGSPAVAGVGGQWQGGAESDKDMRFGPGRGRGRGRLKRSPKRGAVGGTMGAEGPGSRRDRRYARTARDRVGRRGGISVPDLIVAAAVVLGAAVFVCCCLRCCRKRPEEPTISETFKWPSSSKFLKEVDPAHPPEMTVEKYVDPIRTEAIPIDSETHWTVVYQPNSDRKEVKQRMYLRFRDGAVYGVGFEDVRRLCKISGKYKLNKGNNQIGLAMTCRFSNERDTVMFHGWGNGTGLVGNCYVREVDQFSMLSSVPGLRTSSLASIKYKASFLMLKMAGMGDPQLRARLHMRRVHKWAGHLFPDDSVPLPESPLRSPGAARDQFASSENAETYTHVEGAGSGAAGRTSRSPPASSRKPHKGSFSVGGGKKKFLGVFSSFRRKRPATSPTSSPSSPSNELPPWVRQPSDVGRPTPNDGRGRGQTSGSRRPPTEQRPIDALNYLQVEGP